MAFSRDDLTAYEKQPQTQVADSLAHVMKGATPAKAADPAAVAALAAGKTDATPAANAGNNSADDPSGDEVESGDQTGTGDGTSDDNADSSTASAERSGESEASGENDEHAGEEAQAARQAPKKGSAAERIQELLDLTEGYKEYGQLKDSALKEALAELARVKAGNGTSAPTKTEAEAPPVEDEPMPDLSDPDVNFDTDKLRVKTQKWIKQQAKAEATAIVNNITGKTAVAKLEAEVNAKVAEFSKTHPDFDKVVNKNPVLIANQLTPEASLAVAQSEYAADILYAFGQDPTYAVRVAKQTTAQQLKELGKLEAKIEAAKAVAAATTTQPDKGQQPAGGAKPAKQKSLTQAPPPPTPTRAAGRPTEREETDPNLSMDDFAKRHRERKQVARAASRKARGLE
jgi:hypothetical protein